MRAVITKVNKTSTTTYVGSILADYYNKITILCIKKDGSTTIKSFSKDRCNVTRID